MNKDIYYIEPEDDITDIINRLKTSKQKIIALVPPKKVSILRSAINLKLIVRTAKTLDKAVVIVTLDPALMKLSAAAGLPFAKNLQSRPILPSEFKEDISKASPETEETISNQNQPTLPHDEISNSSNTEESASKESPKNQTKKNPVKALLNKRIAKSADKKTNSEISLDSAEVESSQESESNAVKKIPSFDKLRKWIILGAITTVFIICLSVWALVFAPAAKISVKIKTTPDNFSENITFATSVDQASNKEGKILLETETLEKETSVEFEATGERNDGNKATGKLTLTANFNFSTTTASATNPDKISIPTGSAFAKGNLNFLTTTNVDFSWDGSAAGCTSRNNNICQVRKTVDVIAFEGGTKFNIDASASGWQSSVNHVDAFNPAKMSGGTDKIVKIVSAPDVEKAKLQLGQIDEGKDELFAKVQDSDLRIDASYQKSMGEVNSIPAIGEVASTGKAKLSTKVTYKVNILDKKAIEEYIKTLVNSRLGEDQRIYDISSLFIERFQEGNGTSAKLKAVIKTGPEVTEKTVLDKSLGKKIGEVTTLIKSINGVSEVKVDTSFPWVRSIPSDVNKVSVDITIEDKN